MTFTSMELLSWCLGSHLSSSFYFIFTWHSYFKVHLSSFLTTYGLSLLYLVPYVFNENNQALSVFIFLITIMAIYPKVFLFPFMSHKHYTVEWFLLLLLVRIFSSLAKWVYNGCLVVRLTDLGLARSSSSPA